MKTLIVVAAIAALLTSGLAHESQWSPAEYPISFWCGPPAPFATPDRYKQIAAAGFNYVMPACEGASTPETNRKILDGCKAAGIKAFIYDERLPLSIFGVPDARQRLDDIVAAYAKHPALAGYFITDEPSVDKFAGLAEVVEYLRKKDPLHPAYINLFPNNAGPARFGPVSYDAYVKGFIETVKPFAVSYDHYHFLTDGGDQDDYFENLETVRALSEANGLPFWQIVQAIRHTKYRQPTEAEKRYDAMHTLAYGGQGLVFFTYWTPPGKEFERSDGIIKRDGMPSKQYDEIKRVNADVRTIGKYLLGAVRVATFQSGTSAPGGKAREQGTPIAFSGAGDVTVGVFRADTHLYVLFANRDCKNITRCEALLSTAGLPVERLDKQSGRWRLIKTAHTLDGELKAEINLALGDGDLYRW